MKTLKTLALIGASALAVSALSTAAVQAQPYGHAYGHRYEGQTYGYGHRDRVDFRLSTANLDRLTARVDQLGRSGAISHGWAVTLQRELASVRPIAWRAQNGRAGGSEIRRLTDTVTRIDTQTQRYAYNDRVCGSCTRDTHRCLTCRGRSCLGPSHP